MTALVLLLLLAADPGAAAAVPQVGLPCQRATIVEFFKLVRTGKTTIGDVHRLSDLDHESMNEEQFQRCLLFPSQMHAALCTTDAESERCVFDLGEDNIGLLNYRVLPPDKEAAVQGRVHDEIDKTKSELAAYLLARWPEAFSAHVKTSSITGPVKNPKYPRDIFYSVRTKAGDLEMVHSPDSCEILGLNLPDGHPPELDCLWRLKTWKKPASSSPPAPAAKDAAILAASTAPGIAVKPPQVGLVRIVTESQSPHTYSIERPTGAESTIEVGVEFASDRFVLVVLMADRATKVKVEQRHETSLTVQNEGPHLDLVDWKHHVSDWVEVPGEVGGAFRSLPISAEDSSRFPRVEMSSVLAEIGRRDPRWLDVVKDAKSIREYPFSVGVTEISFRILARLGGKWEPVHVVRLRLPMGC